MDCNSKICVSLLFSSVRENFIIWLLDLLATHTVFDL